MNILRIVFNHLLCLLKALIPTELFQNTHASMKQGKNFLFFLILLVLGSYAGGFMAGWITPYVGNSMIAWAISLVVPPFVVWMLIRKFGKKTVT